jgi:hypothetical protein
MNKTIEAFRLEGHHKYADNRGVSRKRSDPARRAAGVTGRRSIRLQGYNYSRPGAYFVTVCAARRGYLLGWISDGRVVENATIVRDCWFDLPNHYPHVSLDAFVVMPDHVHGIVMLDAFCAGNAGAGLKHAQIPNPPPQNPKRSNTRRTEPRYPPPKKYTCTSSG